MNKKTIIILIIIILITSIAGIFWYINNSQKSKVESQKLMEQKNDKVQTHTTKTKNDNTKKVTAVKIKNIENELWAQLESEELTDNRDRKSFIIEEVNDDETVALGTFQNNNINVFAYRLTVKDAWTIEISKVGPTCSALIKLTSIQINFIQLRYFGNCIDYDEHGHYYEKNIKIL